MEILKNKKELTPEEEKELSNLQKEINSFVGRMMTSKEYNNIVNNQDLKESKIKKFNDFIMESYNEKYGNILHLTFKGKDWFEMILNGAKKEEYREIKPYWESRLDGKKFDTVKLQMGRNPGSPSMYVECLGIEKGGQGNTDWGWVEPCYKIKLGRVLKVENYKK
jgi:hypothetical protein